MVFRIYRIALTTIWSDFRIGTSRRKEMIPMATKKPRKAVEMSELGKCCGYVKHAKGFHQTLRPSHGSAPDMHGHLTEKQAQQLRNMIQGWMLRMMRKNGGGS